MATLDDVLVAIEKIDKKADDRHETILREIKRMDNKIDDLERKIVKLEKDKVNKDSEINSIKQEFKKQIWQNNLSHDLLIKGVPERQDETVNELSRIVEQILDLVGVEFDTDSDFTLKRVGKPLIDRPRPITVTVQSMLVKQKALKEKRSTPITLNKIELNGKPIGDKSQHIYIDENLTQTNGKLFKMARDLKKQNLVKYAWTKNGTVYMRQDDNTKVIMVSDENDMQNLSCTLKKRKNTEEIDLVNNPNKISTRNQTRRLK